MNESDRTKFSNLSFRISLAEKIFFSFAGCFWKRVFLLFVELISSNEKEKKKRKDEDERRYGQRFSSFLKKSLAAPIN